MKRLCIIGQTGSWYLYNLLIHNIDEKIVFLICHVNLFSNYLNIIWLFPCACSEYSLVDVKESVLEMGYSVADIESAIGNLQTGNT